MRSEFSSSTECEHFGKAREQIYRTAMRAHFAGNLEGDFQLCQRLPNTRRGNGAEHGTSYLICRGWVVDPARKMTFALAVLLTASSCLIPLLRSIGAAIGEL